MQETDLSDEKLLEIAKNATRNSYAPYSNIHVGAAIVTEDGKIFTGTNIENSSYGLSICAERVAVFNAVSNGYRKFKKIAIITSEGKGIMPCGACRQVLAEFSENMEVITLDKEGNVIRFKLNDLLPHAFRL
ncbi:cytidine deaminase [Acidianus hospitalis]|jgi:cytidine deaminase|uniref:cytidine deaminase n=2 Tax=Acidianus hospitalis TaxID=563177 RepID=A0A2T9X8C4_9CREN|nr:cytidine deaminase [Acidianus hospitalis]AEE93642.1 cytidine deaminase [Acidianus hospitalis W1]PVU76336.1 cytidine deaminase [Acidianus hospitalis]